MNFSDTALRKIKSPNKGQELHFDDQTKGLGLRVGTSGRAVFFVDFYITEIDRETGRLKRRRCRKSLGDWCPDNADKDSKRLNVPMARTLAAEVKGLARAGVDAFEEKRPTGADAISVGELLDMFMVRHAMKNLRPKSVDTYRRAISVHLKPRIGHLRLATLRSADISALHQAIADKDEAGIGGKCAANRTLTALKSALSKAIEWGYLEHNPADRIKPTREKGRMRFLNQAEVGQLLSVLEEMEASPHRRRYQDGIDAVRLALLTGCRKGELLAMRWANLDLEGNPPTWTKPHEDTKQAEWERVPLSAECVAILGRRKVTDNTGSAFVFPSKEDPAKPMQTLKHAWETIRKKAGLEDFRFHDLRHTFASHMAMQGRSLYVIGKMLGHKSPQTTQRYAKLNTATLYDLAEGMADLVRKSAAMSK